MQQILNWRSQFRIFALISAAFFLASCSSNPLSPITDLLGNEDKEDDDSAPAEEDRISILALDEQLVADPRYAGATVDVPPPYINSSWTQPGGESDHTLHHVSAPLELEVLWSVDIGRVSERGRVTAPPIVVSDRIFVIDAAANVSAFNIENGDLIWRKKLAPKIKERFRVREIFSRPNASHIGFGGGVAYDQGRIFVTSGFGFVAALDAISGDEIWRLETEAAVRTQPTAHRGKVYLTTNSNEFIAIEQETGEKVWSFQSFEETARFLSSASPAAAGDLVVAPFSSGEVVAFLTDSGRAVWNETLAQRARLTALASLNDIAGSPVIDRGLVYVVSHGGRLVGIDIRSGQSVWNANITSLQMPWVAGDFIYVVTVDGEVACISRNDGGIIWVSQLQRFKNEKNRKGRIAWAGPVLAGGHLVFVSNNKRIVKMSPLNGEIVEEKKLAGSTVIPPVVADEKLFILTEKGKLIAMQ